MAQDQAQTQKTEPSPEEKVAQAKERLKQRCLKFSGQVLTFIYRPHEGFADFSIVSMRLKDGKVTEVEDISDPYLPFEARARMETKMDQTMETMRRSYPEGHRHV